jgi:GNAT superfamily N-acetyltransferase
MPLAWPTGSAMTTFPFDDLYRRARGDPPPPQREPTPLHELTLSELLDVPDAPERMSLDWARSVADGWRELDRMVARYALRDAAVPSGVPGYSIACHAGARFIAVFDDATGRAVGGLFEGNLYVEPAHQRRGLATRVTTLAFETGLKRIGHKVCLSTGGRATRRAAHRIAVARAVADGIEVKAEVLADYPELRGDAMAAPVA